MDTKTFFASKTNWVAIITVGIGALTALQQVGLSAEQLGYVTAGIGVLNLVLRTLFTSTAIAPKSDY